MLISLIRPALRLPLRLALLSSSAAFDPSDLFTNGEQGAWYDLSDLSTLFQDAAGTIPVTSDGDPVGLVLDKSGNSRNLSQPTTAARPTLQPPGLRFDLADDALTTTLPQAINGNILIAGTKGSIIEPVNYAAGGTFTLGPDTYTGGTPGIMRAIGDIVGLVLIDRTLTQTERDVLIEHYKSKGAKGLLVPGPELVDNPGFPFTSLDGASTNSPKPLTIDDGKIKVTRGTATTYLYINNVPSEIGKAHLVATQGEAGASSHLVLNNPGGMPSTSLSNPDMRRLVFIPTNEGMYRFQMHGAVEGSTAFLNGLSVRELRPQEGWT